MAASAVQRVATILHLSESKENRDYRAALAAGGGGQTRLVLSRPPPTPSPGPGGRAFWLLSQWSAARVESVSLWESLETTAVYQEGCPEMWSLDGEGGLYRFTAFGVCFCSPNWKHTGDSAAAHHLAQGDSRDCTFRAGLTHTSHTGSLVSLLCSYTCLHPSAPLGQHAGSEGHSYAS